MSSAMSLLEKMDADRSGRVELEEFYTFFGEVKNLEDARVLCEAHMLKDRMRACIYLLIGFLSCLLSAGMFGCAGWNVIAPSPGAKIAWVLFGIAAAMVGSAFFTLAIQGPFSTAVYGIGYGIVYHSTAPRLFVLSLLSAVLGTALELIDRQWVNDYYRDGSPKPSFLLPWVIFLGTSSASLFVCSVVTVLYHPCAPFFDDGVVDKPPVKPTKVAPVSDTDEEQPKPIKKGKGGQGNWRTTLGR